MAHQGLSAFLTFGLDFDAVNNIACIYILLNVLSKFCRDNSNWQDVSIKKTSHNLSISSTHENFLSIFNSHVCLLNKDRLSQIYTHQHKKLLHKKALLLVANECEVSILISQLKIV